MTSSARTAVLRISGSVLFLAGCALAARFFHVWLAPNSSQPQVTVTQSTGGNIMVVLRVTTPASVAVVAVSTLALGVVLWWRSCRLRNETRPKVEAG
jgi:hydrogenase/urease accessory protein HupE